MTCREILDPLYTSRAPVVTGHLSPMMKRKQPVQENDVIFDLSDLVEFNVARILYDGSHRNRASLYLVSIRAVSRTNGALKAAKLTAAASSSAGRHYVLKLVSSQCPRARTCLFRNKT